MYTIPLLSYINTHPSWQHDLTLAPYYLTIKNKGPYWMLGYQQFISDMALPLVQQARGIIVRDGEIVCQGFNKFFNYGEPCAHTIDWNTAIVQEKIDGSLLKVWYDLGEWHCSTNGMIDAKDALCGNQLSFWELLQQVLREKGMQWQDWCANLDPHYTHMLELVTEQNQLVVRYEHPELYYLGSRDMRTGQECILRAPAGTIVPRYFAFQELQEVLQAAMSLGNEQEGYVVRDASFNRIKIKGAEYLRLAHIRGNGVPTLERMVELWKKGALDELQAAAPQYESTYADFRARLQSVVQMLEQVEAKVREQDIGSRKELALALQPYPSWVRAYIFARTDNKAQSVQEWLQDARTPLRKMLEERNLEKYRIGKP